MPEQVVQHRQVVRPKLHRAFSSRRSRPRFARTRADIEARRRSGRAELGAAARRRGDSHQMTRHRDAIRGRSRAAMRRHRRGERERLLDSTCLPADSAAHASPACVGAETPRSRHRCWVAEHGVGFDATRRRTSSHARAIAEDPDRRAHHLRSGVATARDVVEPHPPKPTPRRAYDQYGARRRHDFVPT